MSEQTVRCARRAWLVIVLVAGCGASPAPQPAVIDDEAALPCEGQVLVSERPIPEFGLLPSGDPVTSGVALRCCADYLEVMEWGPDSSAAYTIPREHAMDAWSAFDLATTEDERRLIVGRHR